MLVGTATVKILGDVSQLAKDIERQFGRIDVGNIGQEIGDRIGRGIREQVSASLGDLPDMLVDMSRDFEAAGELAGDAFGNGFMQRAVAHLDFLPDAIDGDSMGRQIADDASRGFESNLDFAGAMQRQIQSASTSGGGGTLGSSVADSVSDALRNRIDYGGAGGDGGNRYGLGFRNSFDSWMSKRTPAPFENLITGLLQNIVQLNVMQGVITGVIGAVSSLASAVVMLGSAFVYAAPAALKFGNVLMALGQAGIVATKLFGGVGEAISSYTKMQSAAAKATKSSADTTKKAQADEAERLMRIREARDALNDAIIEGARKNQDAVERVNDAHESLEDAIEGVSDAEEGLRDAIEGVSDAERGVTRAIADEEKALNSINDARLRAQERIEDLRMSLDRASLTEERAALNLKKAEQKLAQARAGGNAQAIYEADLAYREQLQTMREVQERNGDLRNEANKAISEGVDGNQEVLNAQQAYADAVERTSDAYEALTDAQERVRDAQEGIADATERVSDAQRDLKRAMEDVPRTAKDVELAIARAQLNMQKAIDGTDDAMSDSAKAFDTAVNNMNDAFAKLDPAAQDFVRFWVDEVLPVFERIKKAGQAVFFPKLQEAIENLIEDTTFMQLIEDAFVNTSTILGDFAINLSNAFTTPKTLTALKTILDSNAVILQNLATAALNLVQPLSQIFAATAPLAEEWSLSISEATGTFKKFIDGQAQGGENSQLADFFRTANDIAGQLWRIIKNIGKGLGGIFEAALPAARVFLDNIEIMTRIWSSRMNDKKVQKGLTDTFNGAGNNAMSLLELLGAIGGMLFRLGADPGIGKIADAFTAIIPTLESVAQDSFGQISDAIVKIIEAVPKFAKFFTETGTIQTFADIIGTVVTVLGNVVEWLSRFDGLLGIIGKVVGALLAFRLVTGVMGTVAGKAMGIVDSIKKIPDALKGAKDQMSRFVGSLKDFGKKVQGFFDGRKASKQAQNQYWFDEGSFGTKAGAKAAGKTAKQKVKMEVDAEIDSNKLDRDINSIGVKMRRQWEQEAKETEAKARFAAEAIGDGTAQGIEKGLRERFSELAKVSEQAGAVMVKAIKDYLGIKSPSTVMEKQVGDQMIAGIANSFTQAEFDMAAKTLVTEIENELRQAATGLTDVGSDMGNSLEQGLKAATETTGSEVGAEIKNELDKATNGVGSIGTEMGNAVERGLKTATETTGTEVGMEIKRDFGRALNGMSVDAFDEGRDAAVAAKLGAKSAGPVIIDTVTTGGGVGGGLGGKVGKGGAVAGAADDMADAAKKAGKFGKVGSGLSKIWGGFGKVAGKLGLKALGKGFLAILGPVGAVIGAVWMVIDVLGMFGISIDQIINFFKNFSTEAPKLWGKITGAFSAAWDKIKEVFSNLWGKIKAPLEEFGQKVADWFKSNWKTLLMASNPIGLIILFFQNIWPKVQPKLVEFGKKVGAWFKGLPSKISDAAGNIWGWITDKISNIIPAIQQWWSGTFIPWIKGAPKEASEGGGNFWGWITDKVKDIVPAVTDWFTTSFIPWVTGLPGKILGLGIDIFGWVLSKAWDLISGLGKWLVTKLIPWFLTLPFKILSLGIDIFAWIVNKAVDLIPKLANWFVGSFVPWLVGLPGKILNLGINIWGWIIEKAKGLMVSLGTWLRESFIPWVKGLPSRVAENIGNLFGSLKDKAVSGFTSLKTFFTDTVIPWVRGLPQRFADGMSGLWDGLKSGAARASNWVTDKINEYIIPSLNKLPFVDLKELKRIPGYATGGEVKGPNRGDRADNVLARLTPGEYVLTRNMVKQVGKDSLDKWRRGGPPPQGGAKEWFGKATDWVGSLKPDFIDDLLIKGAFHALNTLISNGLSLIPDKDGMIGLVTNYFRNNLQLLRQFADKAQKGLDADKSSGAGGPVEPYKGPADGWTYPLARRFPSYTRSGHNPWFAYDIGSPTGIVVQAVSSGRVITSADRGNKSYGQYLAILHHDNTRSLYAHLSKRFVGVGTKVRVGQRIGLSGNTGGSTGPHLHFELGFDDARRMMARRGVRLAKGGIVKATPGGVPALLAEGGRHERVTPLDSKGRSQTEVEMLAELRKMSEALMASGVRGGDTFQIFPAPGMSERELAVKVSREVAFRHRRRA
jgi:hypothetical protein